MWEKKEVYSLRAEKGCAIIFLDVIWPRKVSEGGKRRVRGDDVERNKEIREGDEDGEKRRWRRGQKTRHWGGKATSGYRAFRPFKVFFLLLNNISSFITQTFVADKFTSFPGRAEALTCQRRQREEAVRAERINTGKKKASQRFAVNTKGNTAPAFRTKARSPLLCKKALRAVVLFVFTPQTEFLFSTKLLSASLTPPLFPSSVSLCTRFFTLLTTLSISVKLLLKMRYPAWPPPPWESAKIPKIDKVAS